MEIEQRGREKAVVNVIFAGIEVRKIVPYYRSKQYSMQYHLPITKLLW